MPTPRQLELIEELLSELDWTQADIAGNVGPEFQDYEDLDVEQASELIENLIEEKRARRSFMDD